MIGSITSLAVSCKCQHHVTASIISLSASHHCQHDITDRMILLSASCYWQYYMIAIMTSLSASQNCQHHVVISITLLSHHIIISITSLPVLNDCQHHIIVLLGCELPKSWKRWNGYANTWISSHRDQNILAFTSNIDFHVGSSTEMRDYCDLYSWDLHMRKCIAHMLNLPLTWYVWLLAYINNIYIYIVSFNLQTHSKLLDKG